MTLIEVIREIEDVASRQPSVNMIIENDFDKLNGLNDAQYGVFAFQQEPHTERLNDDTIGYHFYLLYADREIEDDRNQIEIQSTGIATLSNILHNLYERGIYCDDAVTYQPFSPRFADNCAGVYCDVLFVVEKDNTCEEVFPKKDVKILK